MIYMTEYYTDIDRDGHEISRFGGLPRELYFPKGLYFPEDGWYFIRPGRYLLYKIDGQNDWFPQNCMCSMTTTKFGITRLGVCIQSKTERKLDSLRVFYYDVLLLTNAYSVYAVHFFLGWFPTYGFLTGCLCALNYMSKLDHLISSFNKPSDSWFILTQQSMGKMSMVNLVTCLISLIFKALFKSF